MTASSSTRVIRSATGTVIGSLLLVTLAVAPAAVLHLSGSLIAAVVCLIVALMSGALVFTLMSSQKLVYGPSGVYVVADYENHAVAWDRIDRFEHHRWHPGGGEPGRGLVIRLKSGQGIAVDWINTKRTARRLNAALSAYSGRPVPEISAKPTGGGQQLTFATGIGLFNVFVLRIGHYWPPLVAFGILVDIVAVCAYMGVKISRGE
ncbi:hypothetical protein [Catellatospora tritici]|uniref:hypothetical protein n=1 Tax=Catellatospora tritici TaxID=2851566 RepID=UPI001C2D7509|nr:hypothetical protein [Catellatospora tritici]MBV1853827.1 hypothetical protein [Catellatospora tritici]